MSFDLVVVEPFWVTVCGHGIKNTFPFRLWRHFMTWHFYFAPCKGAKYCDQHVCVYICLSVRSYTSTSETTCPNFRKCSTHVKCGRGWLGFPPTAMQYVTYFRFREWLRVFTQWRQWSRIKHGRYVSPRSPGGGTGAKLDILLVLFVVFFC